MILHLYLQLQGAPLIPRPDAPAAAANTSGSMPQQHSSLASPDALQTQSLGMQGSSQPRPGLLMRPGILGTPRVMGQPGVIGHSVVGRPVVIGQPVMMGPRPVMGPPVAQPGIMGPQPGMLSPARVMGQVGLLGHPPVMGPQMVAQPEGAFRDGPSRPGIGPGMGPRAMAPSDGTAAGVMPDGAADGVDVEALLLKAQEMTGIKDKGAVIQAMQMMQNMDAQTFQSLSRLNPEVLQNLIQGAGDLTALAQMAGSVDKGLVQQLSNLDPGVLEMFMAVHSGMQ